jgi:hypothetical protein
VPIKKNRLILVFLAAASILSSCASGPAYTKYKDMEKDLFPIAPAEGMILFYRKDLEGPVYDFAIKLDGKCLGTIKYRYVSSVKLPPGNHTVTSERTDALPISIWAGETKYVRTETQIGFHRVTYKSLKLVSAADAEKETEKLGYSAWNPGDCK